MNPVQCLQETRQVRNGEPATGCRHAGSCTCPQINCSRYNDCDACRAKHRSTLPHCERPVEG